MCRGIGVVRRGGDVQATGDSRRHRRRHRGMQEYKSDKKKNFEKRTDDTDSVSDKQQRIT